MLSTPLLPKRSIFAVLADLVRFHPVATLARTRARVDQRRGEEVLDRMSHHLLDDLGLLSGECYVTDWGLYEAAVRVRRHRC